MASSGDGLSGDLANLKIWEDLQNKIDDDSKIREEIKEIVQKLEKKEKMVLMEMSKIHSSGTLSESIRQNINELYEQMIDEIRMLKKAASPHPFYRYNTMWSRQMQDAAYITLLRGWLGGLIYEAEGLLIPIEEVGKELHVRVNIKDEDTFHLTLEEYLHGMVSLIDELSRLARNSVTQGNYQRAVRICDFIKDLNCGWQVLNLKNDSLRRRTDGIKYRVREVEDVVYDLSLRGLLPKNDPRDTSDGGPQTQT